MIIGACVCYLGSQCVLQKQKSLHGKESSDGKEVFVGNLSKKLPSNNEDSEGGGHSKKKAIAKKKEGIEFAARTGDKQKAERLLQEIFDAGHVPEVCIYNYVLNVCAKKGDVACAEAWF